MCEHRNRGAARVFAFLALFVLLGVPLSWAEEDASVPKFNAIRTPESPGFILLGKELASVEHPTTPAGFASSFVNDFARPTSDLADFAMEVAPYWLYGHPKLEWESDIDRSPWESILRTGSVGLIRANVGTGDTPVTGVAATGRFSVFSGSMTPHTQENMRELEGNLADQSEWLANNMSEPSAEAEVFRSGIAELTRELTRVEGDTLLTDAEKRAKLDAIESQIEALAAELEKQEKKDLGDTRATKEYKYRETEIRKKVPDFELVRQGFFLSVAGGAAFEFPDRIFKDGDLTRWGIWVDPSYMRNRFSVDTVIRYMGSETDSTAAFLDLGGRLVNHRGQFAASVEVVHREASGGSPGDGWRVVGTVDYAIRDGMWLNGSFGKDYDEEAKNSIIAILGVSLNLSRAKLTPRLEDLR